MKEFAEWLVSMREAKNYSQEDLAQRLGVHTRSVTRWEGGRLPTNNMVRRIAVFFGEDPDELVSSMRKGRSLPTPGVAQDEIRVPFYARKSVRAWASTTGIPPHEWVGRLVRFIEKSSTPFQTFIQQSIVAGLPAELLNPPSAAPAAPAQAAAQSGPLKVADRHMGETRVSEAEPGEIVVEETIEDRTPTAPPPTKRNDNRPAERDS